MCFLKFGCPRRNPGLRGKQDKAVQVDFFVCEINTDDNLSVEAEFEFESCEEQEPDLGKINEVSEGIDKNSVSCFYESFAQEVSNDRQNTDYLPAEGAEFELESREEQEPEQGKINDVDVAIGENVVSPGEAREIESKSFEEQKSHQEEKGERLTIRENKKLKSLFFLCKMCPAIFKEKHLLERHTELHLTKKTYTCVTCSKVFKVKGSLTRHMNIHNRTEKFKCDVCELTFEHKYLLDLHLRLHGRGKPRRTEKNFFCAVCDKSFTKKNGLKQHEKLHMNEEYKCRFCDKTFPTESYRKKHEGRHGGKKFKCHLCPNVYASDNGLKYHIVKHTGETHYPCDICGDKFSRLRDLNEHTNIHTGKKPYGCKMCGVAYASSGTLFVHEKKCKLMLNDESAQQVNEEVVFDENILEI